MSYYADYVIEMKYENSIQLGLFSVYLMNFQKFWIVKFCLKPINKLSVWNQMILQ